MKSLLFVIPTMRMGGAEKSLVSLLNALDPARVQVDLLLFEGGGVLQSQLPNWVHVIEADPVTRGMIMEIRYHWMEAAKKNPAAAAARLWMSVRPRLDRRLKLPKKFSWDLAKHYIPKQEKHYDVAIGYLEGFTDYYVIDKVDAEKKIGWIHTDMSKMQQSEKAGQYYGMFDHLVTITDACRDAVLNKYPAFSSKISVIQNLVSVNEIRRKAEEPCELRKQPDAHMIVTIGRLEPAKGIDIAVETCHLLKERKVPVFWHVLGDGSLRNQLEAQIDQLGLQENMVLHGTVSNPYSYLKAADVVVQPSRWEGKSVVLDEAKLLGKAIVVTNYPSVSDQIRHGETGWIVEITPTAIADGIELVLNDMALRMRLEKNCSKTPDNTAAVLEAFYHLIDD